MLHQLRRSLLLRCRSALKAAPGAAVHLRQLQDIRHYPL